MTQYRFEGKAVSCNRRLTPGRGRIIADPGYRAFLAALTLTFRSQRREPAIARPDVLISATVGALADVHNLGKPVLDALELAGVIVNDKDVNWLTFAPPERHPRGVPDLILVSVWDSTKQPAGVVVGVAGARART